MTDEKLTKIKKAINRAIVLYGDYPEALQAINLIAIVVEEVKA